MDARNLQLAEIEKDVNDLRWDLNADYFLVQTYILEWQDLCFGEKMTRLDRAGHAFIEEAIELAQAVGISELDVLAHVRRIFSKPIGDIKQEIGGVMLTLAPVARALDLKVGALHDINDIALDELTSCIERTDAIAAKYALKEKTFLPE